MRNIKRPNVIFILSDQHNAKVLGYKKHPDVKTPNLDKLAAEGVSFENAITQNPICTPSRVSWISGQYCHNHGYYGLSGPNPNGLPTIFGYFRKYGYKTAAIGKIHCPEYWVEDDCDEFAEVINCSIGGNPKYAEYLKEKGIEGFEDIALPEFGKEGRQTCDARPSNLEFKDTSDGFIVSSAIEFMDNALMNEGNPFFVHISFPKPHQCYVPCKEFWDLYDESNITLPPNSDYDMKNKAPHLKKTAEKWRTDDWFLFEPRTFEAGRLRKLHGYLGNITQVDHAVGEIMKWVDEKGISEDTIIIYSSDHGDYACEHGIMEKAPGICSDAITRIPYIWKWSGHFKSGHIAREIVETVDMTTTLCSLVGIDTLETSDGKDITSLLMGERKEIHKIGVTEFAWSKSIRKGKYRFVYYPNDMFKDEYPEGFGELYDLETDPWEMNNLYFEDEYQNIIKEMKEDLLDWLITTTRPKTCLGVKQEKGKQGIVRYKNRINFDGKLNPDYLRKADFKNYL